MLLKFGLTWLLLLANVSAVNFLAGPINIDPTEQPLKIGGLFRFGSNDPSLNFAEMEGIVEAFQQAVAANCAIDRLAAGQFASDFRNIQDELQGAKDQTIDLLAQPVIGIIGPTMLPELQLVASIMSPSNTPQFNMAVESLVTLRSIQTSSLFQTFPTVHTEVAAIIATLQHFGWTLFTAIFDRSAYGFAGLAQITAQAAAADILLTCSTTLSSKKTYNETISLIAQCLDSSSKSSVVLLWMDYDLAQKVIGSLYSHVGNKKITFLASDRWAYMFVPQGIAIAKASDEDPFPADYLEGTIGFLPYSAPPPEMKACFSELTSSSRVKGMTAGQVKRAWELLFVCELSPPASTATCPERITARTGSLCRCTGNESFDANNIVPSASYAWDAVAMLAQAVAVVKSGDCSSLPADMQGICSGSTVSTRDISRIISVGVLPNGATGGIHFSKSSRIDTQVAINQFRRDGSTVNIGTYTRTTKSLTIDDSALQFKDNKTPVSEIIPHSPSLSRNPASYVPVSLVGIEIVIILLLMLYFYKHKDHPVVRKASYAMLELLLFGLLLLSAAVILGIVVVTVASCIISTWLLLLAAGIIFGVLLAKTYRIYRIFNNSALTTTPIGYGDLLVITGLVVFGFVLIAAIVTFATGLMRPTIIQNDDIPTLQIVQCRSPSTALFTVFAGLLIGYIAILILATCILVYLTRHVDSAYNESRYLGILAYLLLEIAIVFLPIDFVAFTFSAGDLFSIRALCLVVIIMLIMSLICFPKVVNIHRENKIDEASRRARDRQFEQRILEVESSSSFDDSDEEHRFMQNFERRRRGVTAEGPTVREDDPVERNTGLMSQAIGNPAEYATQNEMPIWAGPTS